mmetsp:Transcript_7731/g.25652  ORF Transcript_7731/g.25652 Transcript_7731/m.25652 type:complete len:226 (+) Transcript_7731:100-777(+)
MEPPSAAEEEAARGDAGPGGVVFVLEMATLETAKIGKNYAILNCDDHKSFLLRNNRDPADYRPDILHQALLAVLDSPLNKAGKVKGVFVNTQKGVLFEVDVHTRIPRTFKRFCGLMVQLLQKLSIRASNGPNKLLKVIKQPVTKYLPPNARRVGFSVKSGLKNVSEYAQHLPDETPVVLTVGAMAHGKVDVSYCDEWVAVSEYPLSAACCIARVCNSFEAKWNIV